MFLVLSFVDIPLRLYKRWMMRSSRIGTMSSVLVMPYITWGILRWRGRRKQTIISRASMGEFPLSLADTIKDGFRKASMCRNQAIQSRSYPPLHTIKPSVPNLEQTQLVVLCHYSMRVWDRSHYGSWHLYGHSHGNLPPLKNSLDVSVDCWGYRPVSIDMIYQDICEQKT